MQLLWEEVQMLLHYISVLTAFLENKPVGFFVLLEFKGETRQVKQIL